MNASFEARLPPLCDELIKRLCAADGDVDRERVAVVWAVAELKTFYSGDTPADVLRDSGTGHEGVGMAADDTQLEWWRDLIADACGH